MFRTTDTKYELTNWKFLIDQQAYGEGAGWHTAKYDHSKWMDITCPSCWETYDYALENYENAAWFYTTVTVSEDSSLFYTLHFDGVGGTAKVFVNGKFVGGTESRYLPFDLDVSAEIKAGKENAIAVLVDNRFVPFKKLPGYRLVEWVLYGGLTHKISLIEHKAVTIEHLEIKADMNGLCRVNATVRNQGRGGFKGTLELGIDGLKDCTASLKVDCPKKESVTVSAEMQAKDAKLWSPEHPNLYILRAALKKSKETVHEASDRFGFRTIAVNGKKLSLNGEDLILKGANRYDDYAPYGICPPEDKIRDDLLEMKRFGMNIVRTHYPQDPIHYEIADEIGLIYMIEVVANWWQTVKAQTEEDIAAFKLETFDCIDKTYYYHCNHACWLIWSIFNECEHSCDMCQSHFRVMGQRMRAFEPQRLIACAANRPILDEKELDYVDFLGLNLYTGVTKDCWSETEKMLDKLRDRIATSKKFYPDKPFVLTEFGSPCVFGLHGNGEDGRFTEEFASRYMVEAIKIFSTCENIRGLVMWCWADYRHNRLFIPGNDKDTLSIKSVYGPYGLKTIDRKTKTLFYQTTYDMYRKFDGEHEIKD